jgi:hypothetical protein
MTRQEAQRALELNWWKSLSPVEPVNRRIIVGALADENDHEYGFYAYPSEDGTMPPDDLDEWDIWYISKNGESCGVRMH